MKLRSKCGFTLIELLVVIAIIAILAAILFPVFTKAKEVAKKAACISNLHQLGIAMVRYTDDSNGRFPPLCVYVTPKYWQPVTTAVKEKVWRDFIFDYLKSYTAMYCPSRPNAAEFWAGPYVARRAAEKKIGVWCVGYGINLYLTASFPASDVGTKPIYPPPSHLLSEVRSTKSAVMIGETGRNGFTEFIDGADPYGMAGAAQVPTSVSYDKMSYGLHGGGGCIAYVDCHVAFMPFEEWRAPAEALQSGDPTKPLYAKGRERSASYLW